MEAEHTGVQGGCFVPCEPQMFEAYIPASRESNINVEHEVFANRLRRTNGRTTYNALRRRRVIPPSTSFQESSGSAHRTSERGH